LTFRLFFIFLKTKMKKIKNFYQKIQLFQDRLIIKGCYVLNNTIQANKKFKELEELQEKCLSEDEFIKNKYKISVNEGNNKDMLESKIDIENKDYYTKTEKKEKIEDISMVVSQNNIEIKKAKEKITQHIEAQKEYQKGLKEYLNLINC
ncbi:MAG: hypothetical protein AMS24_03725, partial [Chlamydiae bacterium SM23_39]